VTAPDGRVHLFVRNAENGVSTRVRAAADGSWGPWRALPGTAQVQDGLAVSLDASGRVHVYAAGRESVRHWVDGVERTKPLPLSGSTVATAGGELYYRAPAAGALLGPGGDAGLAGFGGVVAAGSASLGTVLLGTDADGRLLVRSGGRLRTRTAGPSAVSAALHLGAPGVTVVGLGADGHPWSWRP
ncbi:PIG-L family deacetylase, partial [Streptomyces sp. SR27]|nr:PIG-L family deacetylase [Streptomyces sp. SR27]